mgnify:CR=1 FL=1
MTHFLWMYVVALTTHIMILAMNVVVSDSPAEGKGLIQPPIMLVFTKSTQNSNIECGVLA